MAHCQAVLESVGSPRGGAGQLALQHGGARPPRPVYLPAYAISADASSPLVLPGLGPERGSRRGTGVGSLPRSRSEAEEDDAASSISLMSLNDDGDGSFTTGDNTPTAASIAVCGNGAVGAEGVRWRRANRGTLQGWLCPVS